jgi:nitrite reductase/ring-hydroxylating ferredoxin subunit
MKHQICSVDEIPQEGSKVLPFFGREVHVYREKGQPRAALNVCLHLGGPLDFKEGKFVCAWHGAEFATSGGCVKGPAAKESRLMFLPTRVENGGLFYVWGE